MRLALISIALLMLTSCRFGRKPPTPDEIFAQAKDVTGEARYRFFFAGRGGLQRFDCPPEALASAGNSGDRATALRDTSRLCQPVGAAIPLGQSESALKQAYLQSVDDVALTVLELKALNDLLRSLGTQPGSNRATPADPLVRAPFDAVRERFMTLLEASFATSAAARQRASSRATVDMQTVHFPSTWDVGSVFMLVLPHQIATKSLAEIRLDVRGASGDTCAHVVAEPVRLSEDQLHVRLVKSSERVAACRLLVRTVDPPKPVRPASPSPLRLWSHLWFGIRTAWPWMSEDERRALETALGKEWCRPHSEREDALVPHRGEELFHANRRSLAALASPSSDRAPAATPRNMPASDPAHLRALSLSEWGDEWDAHFMALNAKGDFVELPRPDLEQALTAWLTANGYRNAADQCAPKDSGCYQWRRTWLGGKPTTYAKLRPTLQRLLRTASLTPWTNGQWSS